MNALVPAVDLLIEFNTGMDINVLGFTLGLTLLTSIIFGFAPAIRLSKADVAPQLKEAAKQHSGRSRLRTVLVIAQVTLSVIALVCAGLFVRSLQNAYRVDLGFDPDEVLMVSLDVFPNGYTTPQGRAFYQRLLEDVKALPGVTSATLARRPPLTMRGARGVVLAEIEGYQPRPDEQLTFIFDTVGADFFETLKIPILRGRGFTADDRTGAPLVVIVSEGFARRYWPNQDPVGKRIRRGDNWMEVIGLAKDIKNREITDSGRIFLYTAHQQIYEPDMTLIVRGNDAASLAEPIRNVVQNIDDDLALFGIMPMSSHVGNALSAQRAAASGAGVFGLLALTLAVIGMYGLISYSVSQRTQEIGVRMALGARRGDVYRLVLGHGLRSIAVGLVIGLAVSAFLTRYLEDLLFGVRSSDPVTFAGVAAVLLAAGLLASFIPARKATRVDPVTALRHE
jgi:predicted permease